ncbi:hypothetical protein SFC55_25055 [Niallia taxi]|uniref:hypothetical protein n=1 Tax=Niallia taxi TaxID=2499688 RepID=UPI003981BD41
MKLLKKLIFILLVILLFIAVIWGYIHFRKNDVKKAVNHYLIEEKNIPEDHIKYSEPFIANLQGPKNWMVGIKIKGDEKIYYYYKDNENKVILESWTENGVEYMPTVNVKVNNETKE